MIQLVITKTVKSFSPKDDWRVIDGDGFKHFLDLESAKAWLKETYGKASRRPMYVDGKDGEARKVGIIFGYRDGDWSHSPVQKWLAQDWVEFREVHTIDPGK